MPCMTNRVELARVHKIGECLTQRTRPIYHLTNGALPYRLDQARTVRKKPPRRRWQPPNL